MLATLALLAAAPLAQHYERELVPADRLKWVHAGSSVGISGDWIVVGGGIHALPIPSGPIENLSLFRRAPSGDEWNYVRPLTSAAFSAPPLGIAEDWVAMEGEHIVLVAGGVLISFRFDAGLDDWIENPVVPLPPLPTLSSPLGSSRIRISGDRAIVSNYDISGPGPASILVVDFDRATSSWVLTASIQAPSSDPNFGLWARVDGDTIIAHSNAGGLVAGRLRIYTLGANGWSESQVLEGASFAPSSYYFGAASDVEGNRLALVTAEGDALIFERADPSSPFVLTASFTAGPVTDDVRLEDETLVLGQESAGAVEIWRRVDCAGPGWTCTHRLTTLLKHNGTTSTTTRFGASVALQGDTLVAGASHYAVTVGTGFGSRTGAASVFHVPVDINSDGVPDVCQTHTFEDVDADGVLDILESPGSRFCSPNAPTSLGSPARLLVQGSTFAADNQLYLSMIGVPRNAFSIMLASRDFGFTPAPGGSAGNLCLSGQIGRRFGSLHPSARPQEDNILHRRFDLSFSPTQFGVGMLPGETWYFQGWFRDGPSSSNFTDAMRVFLQ